MNMVRKPHLARSLITLFGALLIVAGAGMAFARTRTGPPFAQPTDCATTGASGTSGVSGTSSVSGASGTAQDCPAPDRVQEQQKVQTFFSGVANDCGTAFLGQAIMTDQQTVAAFSSLVDSLNSGQTDHMVNSVRVLLQNCASHPNDGLKNALYHHGLNWLRHYQHEQWLEQKFADKWPNGKPGSAHGSGKPDKASKPHGNPHDTGMGGSSHGHGSGSSGGGPTSGS